MPILMEEALKFASDPNIVRYGAILKNSSTGRIVGHLKETGDMARLISNLPLPPVTTLLNPVVLGIEAIDKVTKSIQIHGLQKSVAKVQETLEVLQLTTNVAVMSSMASLGISVAGFAVVNSKLNKIESTLDGVTEGIKEIQKSLKDAESRWDAMSTARLQRAAKYIISAEGADTHERRQELLKKAVDDFSLLKQYYSELLHAEGLFADVGISVEQLQELVARYTFCCMGLLHAEFKAGDLGTYSTFLREIEAEYLTFATFSPKSLYLERCDNLDVLAIGHDHKAQSESLIGLSQYTAETVARIESHRVELEYVEKNHLTVDEYLTALREHETDIVLLPR